MDRVDVLCSSDRDMMFEFSRLCVRRLNKHLPLRIFLSVFQHFLDANVLKEIEKDRLIIEYAASVFEKGKDGADIDLTGIFEMTKKVDSEFVKKMATPLLSIEIRYEDFAEIRKQRIKSLLNMTVALLQNWQDETPYAEVVKSTFPEKNFKEVLGQILHLYNLETRMLSNSISFHGPAGRIKDLFAAKLFATMEKTAGEIAVEYTRRIYLGKGCSCVNPI